MKTPKPACCSVSPRRHRMSVAGFTLVELLTVIAIIGILAGILIATVGPIREKARLATCLSNLRQIGAGAALVVADNRGLLPNRLDSLNNPRNIEPYLYPQGRPVDGGVFHCPSADSDKTSSLGAQLGETYLGLSYGRNNALGSATVGLRLAQIQNPSKRMLAIESNTWNFSQVNVTDRFAPRHHGPPTQANPLGEMANILFIDGHVESRVMSMNPIDQAEWDELGTGGARSNMTQ